VERGRLELIVERGEGFQVRRVSKKAKERREKKEREKEKERERAKKKKIKSQSAHSVSANAARTDGTCVSLSASAESVSASDRKSSGDVRMNAGSSLKSGTTGGGGGGGSMTRDESACECVVRVGAHCRRAPNVNITAARRHLPPLWNCPFTLYVWTLLNSSLSKSLRHTHAHTHTISHTLSLGLNVFYSQRGYHTQWISLTHANTHSLFLLNSLLNSFSLSPSPLTHSLHTRTHLHFHTLSLACLMFSLLPPTWSYLSLSSDHPRVPNEMLLCAQR
jgi:hypothetical protein